ncbi:MAG TPA: ATP synthase F1 subunit gamma [Deltaproteobacteria bacterium]|nr:ATP synthase F1 subunit gamma [Deltaproteobacteria bacterium]
MATLKTIRKRITSVKNTQKITKAMKMVAAAKLRRAQSALVQARPHRELLTGSLRRLLTQARAWEHPWLIRPEPAHRAEILILSSDRGLCGGFNGNLFRRVENWTRHEGKAFSECRLSTMGRKGRDYYRAKNIAVHETLSSFEEDFSFRHAQEWAQQYIERFQAGEFQVLYLAFNHFHSAISQEPILQQILPLDLQPEEQEGPPLYWEGRPQEMLDRVLPRYVATLLYIAVLESRASELGARMSAMENATNNAKEMIGSLTLQYNRARQAAITTELMDIVNGAEALK